MTQPRNWIATASADHVRIGRELGIMQVCHGKAGPLRRIAAGDRIAYYSPRSEMRGGATVRSFTALGIVADDAIHQVEMASGLCPFRRRVAYLDGVAAPILPLLEALDFTRGKRSWGYAFRWGLFEVSDESMAVIAAAMQIALPEMAA
jgi:hypothetical protein